MHSTQEIRPPAVAGIFYHAAAPKLIKMVESLLQQVQHPPLPGKLIGLVSPHAGYMYSGLTAAHSYKMLEGKKYECVIIVGPSHREYFPGVSVYPGEAYQTPLGNVRIHAELRDALLKHSNCITASSDGHSLEHSIEVQLPFLQQVLGEFQFIPLVIGDQDSSICSKLAQTLADVIGSRNILLVASSDLSHYHTHAEAVSMDEQVLDEVRKFDASSFLQKAGAEEFEACGGGPIGVVMQTAKLLGANHAEVLHYCTSGDITGDKSKVVGYMSAAFTDEVR
jgi:MEMO1 family protein